MGAARLDVLRWICWIGFVELESFDSSVWTSPVGLELFDWSFFVRVGNIVLERLDPSKWIGDV
jgi:hypothetical protein